MQILLLSDIHANLMALESVLSNSPNFDEVWCLGDIVGYGPNPNECIELIREQKNLKIILGNHDAAAIKLIGSDNFNLNARISTEWTREELTSENLEYLQSLPEYIETSNCFAVHGSPHDKLMEYVLDNKRAKKNFRMFEQDFCFVGHSHLPIYFQKQEDGSVKNGIIKKNNQKLKLKKRMICNPGSVGQPRDRNSKASFAIFDDEELTLTYLRVKYDVEKTKKRMAHHQLPLRHIARLEHGY